MLCWYLQMARRFLAKVLVSALALWLADVLLPGFAVTGGFITYGLAGLLLGTLNTFVRPILKLLTFPLILITLGLFTVIINAGILWFVAHTLSSSIYIDGLWTLLWVTFIISAVQTILDPKK
jgi:putative membrane protein